MKVWKVTLIDSYTRGTLELPDFGWIITNKFDFIAYIPHIQNQNNIREMGEKERHPIKFFDLATRCYVWIESKLCQTSDGCSEFRAELVNDFSQLYLLLGIMHRRVILLLLSWWTTKNLIIPLLINTEWFHVLVCFMDRLYSVGVKD